MLFEQTLIKFFAFHSESFTKYDAFCTRVYYCKCKNGRSVDAKKSVNKVFENVLCLRRNQNFFKERTPNFNIFSSVVLFRQNSFNHSFVYT